MTNPLGAPDAQALARQIHRAALAAVDPHAATRHAVAALSLPERPVHLIALGKAALAMTRGAVETLATRGVAVDGGCVVSADEGDPPHPALSVIIGDHPVPGPRSLAAADAIATAVVAVPPDAPVLVLLSGGATSLAAAPVADIPAKDVAILFQSLLHSGADIRTMNAVRKRVLRWGAGRLALALAPRQVHAFFVSDVLGDDPAFIASGPVSPDSLTAAKVRRMLARARVLEKLPPSVSRYLDGVHHQEEAETSKPGARIFANVRTSILLSNAHAVAAAEVEAQRAGVATVRVIRQPVTGEAARVGKELAARLVAWKQRLRQAGPAGGLAVTIAGGETTVTMAPDASGRGGRCQELALAAAAELHRLRPRSDGITLLAVGTDGRDGPTDAAGAMVDSATWERAQAAGCDPASHLKRHDAYAALDAAGALVRTGPTGTNVNDLIIAVVSPDT